MTRDIQTSKSPAVFLDRDGTVCEEVGYLKDPDKLKLIPGSAEAIQIIVRQGWMPVMISNQSGIARQLLTVEEVQAINKKLLEMLAEQNVVVEKIYYCPHHPDGEPPDNILCDCRKPSAGLLKEATRDYNLDLSESIMIGDKYSDVETGQRLGIPGLLVKTGFGLREIEKYKSSWTKPPDYIAENLLQAVQWWFNTAKAGKLQNP